jgi:mannose-6-phosphate isomerase-like protein (cupin superfamily)
MLTDATMRVDDGTNITETALASGQAYNRPAGIQHDVMNGSAVPMAFVEIELKRPPAMPPT